MELSPITYPQYSQIRPNMPVQYPVDALLTLAWDFEMNQQNDNFSGWIESPQTLFLR